MTDEAQQKFKAEFEQLKKFNMDMEDLIRSAKQNQMKAICGLIAVMCKHLGENSCLKKSEEDVITLIHDWLDMEDAYPLDEFMEKAKKDLKRRKAQGHKTSSAKKKQKVEVPPESE